MRVELYPAIDLRGGRAVRLMKGDYAAETVYSDDPVEVARAYERAGARWIHVVDLDAARTGEATNLGLIQAIATSVTCAIECGGGVRSLAAAERLIGAGVARVVVGTAAVEQPGLVAEMSEQFPGAVAAGLDARGRDLAVRGWVESSGLDLVDAARRLEAEGAAALIVTEIGRDGTMEGPDTAQLAAVLEAVTVDVIASGGVGTLADLKAIAAMPRPPAGVIVGRALYEGRFSVEEALSCLAPA